MTLESGIAAWAVELRRVGRWWLGEALRRLPTTMTGGPVSEILAELGPAGPALRWRRPDGALEAVPPDQIAGLRGRSAVLRLQPERVLRRRFPLPSAAAPRLRDVVGLELDRRTPLRADQAWFAAEILADDGREIDVAVTVLPRQVASNALAAVESLGLRVACLEIEGDQGPLRLPVEDGAEAGTTLPRGLGRVGLAAGAALVLTIIVYSALAWLVSARESEAAASAAAAARVRQQVEEVEALRRRRFFAVEAKRTHPSMTVAVEALSRLLPEGTWLTELRFEAGTITMIGLSQDSAQLIPLVEGSPHFENAQFRSAIVRDTGGLDRFHLAATVVPHAAP